MSSSWLPSPRTAVKVAAAAAVTLLAVGSSIPGASAQTPGGFQVVQPDSHASAMMMALIDEDNVMIIDKAENNSARLNNGKPVWGTILSLKDNSIRDLDMPTNPFCASGSTLGNGTWLVAGGNQAVGYGGAAVTPGVGPYQVYSGTQAVRLMNPNSDASQLEWLEDQQGLTSMRWYPGIETMTDGSILLIGGATGGGYINRNLDNSDPAFEAGGKGGLNALAAGGANPTWEFYPPRTNAPAIMTFMSVTSGLNMYPHTYLMPSGKLFMQANYSTALWNITVNNEANAYDWLDDMPDQIVRVYPASAATAMLPLTPENNYTPTILFCGGNILTEAEWGWYGGPGTNLYQKSASTDCSSITPEDSQGNLVSHSYVREETLPEPRSMGQFIHLPTEQMVIVNGAERGTAGYSNVTWNQVNGFNLEGLSQSPTYRPVMYDPSKPQGSRLSNAGFASSNIARLYHSSAILVPDGSVLIGGSNCHQDVVTNMPVGTNPEAFNTTYEIEKWYPPYYNEPRPQPQNLPSAIMYGGNTWNFTMDASFMGSSANYKANNTKVMVIRPGFSTHAMNMGQRSMRLAHTYTVETDGSVTYMVNPMPVNQNLFVQGPALLFITIDGVPSIGKLIMVGSSGAGGTIPRTIAAAAAPKALPAAVNNPRYNAKPSESGIESFGIGKLVGIIVAVVAVILLLVLGLCCWRRRARRGAQEKAAAPAAGGAIYGMGGYNQKKDGGHEYKRVHTPTGNPASYHTFNNAAARNSAATFDTYKMNDVSGQNSPYYDHPSTPPLQPGTPRGQTMRSPLSGHSMASNNNSISRQGWGEHQAQGDVGEQYYNDSAYSDPSRFYGQQPGVYQPRGGSHGSHESYNSGRRS